MGRKDKYESKKKVGRIKLSKWEKEIEMLRLEIKKSQTLTAKDYAVTINCKD